MRLPIIDGDAAKIDEAEAIKMIRYAIDNGVNYVDSAYVYHRGNSEIVVGKALSDGYREKVKLATKMPTWLVTSREDMDKYLNEQLARLRTDKIDFYLLHGLGRERWPKLRDMGVLKWMEAKRDEGKIGHLGFSFHDDYPVFKEIIDSYDGWEFCQIQYNYMDTEYQAGTRGLEYAASRGLAVVIMEPIAGGRLAMKPPEGVQSIWDEARVKRTSAEWALRWVWNHPEVSIVLSGMSSMEQVMENVKTAGQSGPNTLTREELDLVERVKRKYMEMGFIGCTGCRYCMPCPQGVDIPMIFGFYNEYYTKNRDDEVKNRYWEHITPESQAKRCARCRKCEQLCPQQLPISDLLSGAAQIFESERRT